ncbi:MAG: hypothetical protein FWF78_02775 [Defluviitaleaceae bacterium]|nr:hypothetical protein [Defluviitaleaceae bacterium]
MKQGSKTDEICLVKVLRHIGDLRDCLAHFEINTHKDFESRRLAQFATTQIITIIHGLKKSIKPETLEKTPEFNKIKIAGARNVASHEYDKVNFRMIFDICTMLTSKKVSAEIRGVLKNVV